MLFIFLLPAAKKWYLWVRGKTVRVRVPHRTHINGSFFFVCSPVFPKLILWFFFLPEFAFDRPLKWKRSWNFPLNLPNGVSISYHNLFFTVFVLTVSVASSVLLFRLSNFKSFGNSHSGNNKRLLHSQIPSTIKRNIYTIFSSARIEISLNWIYEQRFGVRYVCADVPVYMWCCHAVPPLYIWIDFYSAPISFQTQYTIFAHSCKTVDMWGFSKCYHLIQSLRFVSFFGCKIMSM